MLEDEKSKLMLIPWLKAKRVAPMSVGRLDEIGLRFGTDKASSYHDFLRVYEPYLLHLQESPVKLLEIGINEGGSLRTWEEYFPYGKITGVDVTQDASRYATDRITVEVGDQSDIKFLTDLIVRHGPFDIIIDDGSHMWEHQVTTIKYLMSGLTAGGIYIIEDIDTSFGAMEETYRGIAEISTADYLFQFLKYLVGDRFMPLAEVQDPFIRAFAHRVDTLTFSRRTSIFKMREVNR